MVLLDPALVRIEQGDDPVSDDYLDAALGIADHLRALQVAPYILPLRGDTPTPLPGGGTAARVDGAVWVSAGRENRGPYRAGELLVAPAPRPSAAEVRRAGASGSRSEGRAVLVNHLIAELRDGRLDPTSRADLGVQLGRFLRRRRPPRSDKPQLGRSGGLVWCVSDEIDSLELWDAGGILDPNPNTEADPWPQQAMGMYYADAYAAAVFARRAQRGDESWRAAALAALSHVARTYRRYVDAPIWYHHDFKNAPFLEAAATLGVDPVDLGLPPRLLHGDPYEPTNVMAVRLHWLAARQDLWPSRGDRRRIQRCREVLLTRQGQDGLFRDDRPPLHVDVPDLSYHQFTLAFLARYLDHVDDDEMSDAFRRGVDFSATMQLPNGEVALTGRGTNNSYQAAAAIYAFEAAAVRFDIHGYRDRADLAWTYLKNFRMSDGTWPTACNREVTLRMAWNHCATPYNALIAYLLQHASDQRQLPLMDDPTEGRFVGPSRSDTVALLDDGHLYAAVVRGFEGGYAWSGVHRAGVAGCAGLGSRTAGTITLAPDELPDLDDQVTDLPRIAIDRRVVDWKRTTPLTVGSGAVSLSPRDPDVAATVSYRVSEGTLTMTIEVARGPSDRHLEIFGRLPLLGDWQVDTENGGAVVLRGPDDRRVAISAVGTTMGPVEVIHVHSNPRGPGVLVIWQLVSTHLRGGDAVILGYEIELRSH